MSKPCRECNKEFEPERPRQAHCCDRCRELDYNRNHIAKFSPERKRAGRLVATAIFNGRLKRQPCEVCGGGRTKSFSGGDVVQAHHDDYAAPLAVRWLCRSHHKMHHLRFGPGKNAFVISPST